MPDPKHNTTQWDGPKYQNYSTHYARINSYFTWPANSKQRAVNLSSAGFFYTGKNTSLLKAYLFIVEEYIFLKAV